MFKIPDVSQLMAYASTAEAIAEDLHRAVPYVKSFIQVVAPAFKQMVVSLEAEFSGSSGVPGATTPPQGTN